MWIETSKWYVKCYAKLQWTDKTVSDTLSTTLNYSEEIKQVSDTLSVTLNYRGQTKWVSDTWSATLNYSEPINWDKLSKCYIKCYPKLQWGNKTSIKCYAQNYREQTKWVSDTWSATLKYSEQIKWVSATWSVTLYYSEQIKWVKQVICWALS